MNDTNNDDIFRFPIVRLGLYFHNTINKLRYLTAVPEVGLSQAVQAVRCAAYSSDKKTEGSYHPPSALSRRLNVLFYAWFADVWQASSYLSLCDSDKLRKQ